MHRLFYGIFLLFLLTACNQSLPPTQNTLLENPVEVKKVVQADTLIKPVTQKTTIAQKKIVRTYNDNARFIAGLTGEPGSDFIKHEKNSDWKNYSNWFNNTWARVENGQLIHIKQWQTEQRPFDNDSINKSGSDSTLFYPFSGADFLYANAFFPNVNQYIMIGLEPTGKVPDIRKIPTDFWENYFLALRTSLDDILTASFFKTKDMKVDFKIQELKGTLPVLMIFLVRTGHTIVDIESVQINGDGQIENASTATNFDYNQMHGIRITFVKGQHYLTDADSVNTAFTRASQKTICYFPIDLSNTSLLRKPNFEKLVASLNQPKTFIKSASYLMHESNFSSIRSLIIKYSSSVTEDDSGIPLHYFETEGHYKTFNFYGAYKSPIPMFSKFIQNDLKEKYAQPDEAKPLPFRLGYQNQTNKSNLLITKKH